jgi:hypothetical protein
MKQIYRDNYSRANIYSTTRVIYFHDPLATNGLRAELVAAWQLRFFH